MIQKLIFSAFLTLIISIHVVNAAPDCSGTTASTCPAGCYFKAEDEYQKCKICEPNTYSTASGSPSCTPCPDSHPSAPSGSSAPNACYKTCPGTQAIDLGYKTASKNAQYNTECNYDTIHCVANATERNGKCTCNTGYEANTDKTACNPKTFKITLNKNCTNCTVKDGEFFEKYNEGFSNTETGTFVSGNNFTADLSKLDTNKWFGYELAGYYTSTSGGNLTLDNYGKLIDKSSTQFSNSTNLYAHWNGKEYTIHYAGENAPTTSQTCNFGTNCRISDVTGAKACHVFGGWKCTSGCKEQIIINPNTNFDETNINNTLYITLTAQWSVCPNGYYCTNGQKNKCPKPGSTTNNTATTCATKQTDCYISNATMFQDNNGSFKLPIGNLNAN